MHLSDIMGEAGLVSYAEAGLILFVLAFAFIMVYTYSRRNRARYESARFLPLEDDDPQLTPSGREGENE